MPRRLRRSRPPERTETATPVDGRLRQSGSLSVPPHPYRGAPSRTSSVEQDRAQVNDPAAFSLPIPTVLVGAVSPIACLVRPGSKGTANPHPCPQRPGPQLRADSAVRRPARPWHEPCSVSERLIAAPLRDMCGRKHDRVDANSGPRYPGNLERTRNIWNANDAKAKARQANPLPSLTNPGARDGIRTRDPRLGKPMLYH